MINWKSTSNKVYVSADGDNMGSKVSASIVSGKLSKARTLSQLINKGGATINNYAKKTWSSKSVIMGGDDIMVEIEAVKFTPAHIESMRALYRKTTGATLSVGVGSTPEEAMKAIVVAKNTGKNKAVFWKDSLDAEYKKVIKIRINDLKTKLVAMGGKISESAEVKLNAIINMSPAAVRRNAILAAKKAANHARGSNSFFHRKELPNSKLGKNPDIIKQHRAALVNIVKDFIAQRNVKKSADIAKAVYFQNKGDADAAHYFRRQSKLRHLQLMKNKGFLHAAAELDKTNYLPISIRSTVQGARSTMAKNMLQHRKLQTTKPKKSITNQPVKTPSMQHKNVRNFMDKIRSRIIPKVPQLDVSKLYSIKKQQKYVVKSNLATFKPTPIKVRKINKHKTY